MINKLAVIYIYTAHEGTKSIDTVRGEFEKGFDGEYLWVAVDGTVFPDITQCLNIGVKAAIQNNCDYITWAHNDMEWTDPAWAYALANILEAYPGIKKMCASNSRDQIYPFRIGQEQTWLMRVSDFEKHPWLWFDERFIRCGGYEDWRQSVNILSRGGLVCITPDCTVFHKGAQTRSSYDSTQHQLHNNAVWVNGFWPQDMKDTRDKCTIAQKPFPKEIELYDTFVKSLIGEPHRKELFGMGLTEIEYRAILAAVPHQLKEMLALEDCPNRIRIPIWIGEKIFMQYTHPREPMCLKVSKK